MTTWEDHVGQALRLQEAVRCLVSSKKMRERLDHACRHLIGMLPHQSIMPPQQRERLKFILDTRASVSLADGEYYAFDNLKAKDRKALIEAIISLHEACLIDLGRLNDDFTAIIYATHAA